MPYKGLYSISQGFETAFPLRCSYFWQHLVLLKYTCKMHAFLKNAAAMLSTKSMSVGQMMATQGSLARHVRGGSRLSAAASLTAPSAALHIVDRRESNKSSCNQVSEVEHVLHKRYPTFSSPKDDDEAQRAMHEQKVTYSYLQKSLWRSKWRQAVDDIVCATCRQLSSRFKSSVSLAVQHLLAPDS